MRKKKEEVLPVAQPEAVVPAPRRRGRPPKKEASVSAGSLAGEHVLMTVAAAEERLRKIQQDFTKTTEALGCVEKEYKSLLKKCENIKLLLCSYYNLEETGTDKILVPEKKTPYWYVRATFGKQFFDVVQCEWIGGKSDKFRFCRGNFFLDEHVANLVCDSCNALMTRII